MRVRELSHFSRKVEREYLITANALKQWHSTMAKVTVVQGLPAVIRKTSQSWEDDFVTVQNHTPGVETFSLERIARTAEEAATRIAKLHQEARSDSWHNFVAMQIITGAAESHRLVKRDALVCNDTTTVGSGPARTASPQAIVDVELALWREIWLRLEGRCSAPWRIAEPPKVDLPAITEEDIASAAASFKQSTSIGADDFPPKLVASLSLPLRLCIAGFLNAVESTDSGQRTLRRR